MSIVLRLLGIIRTILILLKVLGYFSYSSVANRYEMSTSNRGRLLHSYQDENEGVFTIDGVDF